LLQFATFYYNESVQRYEQVIGPTPYYH